MHRQTLQQIVAVEDFVLFKKLMVGRNKMLNEEAIHEMQDAGRAVNRVQPRVVRQRAPTE